MNRMIRGHLLLQICLFAIVIAGLAVALTESRRASLTNELGLAVVAVDESRVSSALAAGADANGAFCRDSPTVFERLAAWLRRKPITPEPCEPILHVALSRACVVDVPNVHPDNTEVVRLLLQHGANPNGKDSRGSSALVEALWGDNGDAVPYMLLTSGSDPNGPDAGGHTALMIGCVRNDIRLVKELIRRGADVNLRNQDGESALFLTRLQMATERQSKRAHGAFRSEYAELEKMLLALGARE